MYCHGCSTHFDTDQQLTCNCFEERNRAFYEAIMSLTRLEEHVKEKDVKAIEIAIQAIQKMWNEEKAA
jgi:hypothetical protein